MKRIFNTISTKWPEYLLEILVITVGILGAFALNNWNEDRKERVEEQVLLIQLKEEYETNLDQLTSKIATRNALVQSSMELLAYFDHPEIATLDEVVKHISNLGLTVTFDPIQNDLFASGSINRISNSTLKSKLTRWSTDVIQVTEVEAIYLDEFNDHVKPLIARLGIGREINMKFWKAIQQLDFMISQDKISSYNYGKSRFLPPVEELLNNVELEGYVSNSIMMNEFINLEAVSLQKQIEEILELPEEEIKQ